MHAHYAGCALLAKALSENGLPCQSVVHRDGWPKDPSVFQGADAVVIFTDGGGGQPVVRHLDEVEPLMKQGVGLALLHYAVEVPKGEPATASSTGSAATSSRTGRSIPSGRPSSRPSPTIRSRGA